jgi:hypothetical protein
MLQRYLNQRKRGSFLLSADPDLLYAGKRNSYCRNPTCLIRTPVRSSPPHLKNL